MQSANYTLLVALHRQQLSLGIRVSRKIRRQVFAKHSFAKWIELKKINKVLHFRGHARHSVQVVRPPHILS